MSNHAHRNDCLRRNWSIIFCRMFFFIIILTWEGNKLFPDKRLSQVLGVKMKFQLQLTHRNTHKAIAVFVKFCRDGSLVTSCSGCSSMRCNRLCLLCMSHLVLHLFLCPNTTLRWHRLHVYITQKHTHLHAHTQWHTCTSKHLHMLT